jgi:hypothetical protein
MNIDHAMAAFSTGENDILTNEIDIRKTTEKVSRASQRNTMAELLGSHDIANKQ